MGVIPISGAASSMRSTAFSASETGSTRTGAPASPALGPQNQNPTPVPALKAAPAGEHWYTVPSARPSQIG